MLFVVIIKIGKYLCKHVNLSCSWDRCDIIIFDCISISNAIDDMAQGIVCSVTLSWFIIVHVAGLLFSLVTGFFLSKLWDVEINVESRV